MIRVTVLIVLGFLCGFTTLRGAVRLESDGYHVFPGNEIQGALDQAATNSVTKAVWVHEGVYRPSSHRQSLIWFNRSHNGIRLRAKGKVTLTAANPDLAKVTDGGYPAVVNHVVYFGDGVGTNTLFEGFRLTGANGFVSQEGTKLMEPNTTVPKNYFFYSDGGGVKIFGRAYPTLRNLDIFDNFTSPCGAGISVQHQGFRQKEVLMENCILRGNRAQSTGAALDLLEGSAVRMVNCLFVGNISNMGEDPVAKESGEPPFVNNGAVTVFWRSRLIAVRCTFTANRNGVDDLGKESVYDRCVFWDNRLEGGLKGQPRYELHLAGGGRVERCYFNGTILDPKGVIDATSNVMKGVDPRFDSQFASGAAEYGEVGYRPVASNKAP